jgi:hypothetical protein
VPFCGRSSNFEQANEPYELAPRYSCVGESRTLTMAALQALNER